MNAEQIMRSLNPHAPVWREGNRVVVIEDVGDPDGRWYRVEYRCADNGSNATAWLLHNPWGDNPFSYPQSHLRNDGFICYAGRLHDGNSPYRLDFAIKRTRLWCVGYSYLREHGYQATCAVLPDWAG